MQVPPITSVEKVIFNSGETHTLLIGRGDTEFVLPQRETSSKVAQDYTWLGMHHIWVGYDHLLFLLCLLWIAGGLRRILITITGFTFAHSITLALSALGIVNLPVPPIEAVIALSVLFLAVEVAKGPRENLTWRYPIAVSSTFGLLHGLGFAAVLNEIGLPQTEVITGLIFFNVGVEIGQILFAIGVVLLLYLLRLLFDKLIPELSFERHLRVGMGYYVGCIAAYWLIERTIGFAVV
ncbi:MAG: HupE/UreJ family protein [Pseudomonadota bacterium]